MTLRTNIIGRYVRKFAYFSIFMGPSTFCSETANSKLDQANILLIFEIFVKLSCTFIFFPSISSLNKFECLRQNIYSCASKIIYFSLNKSLN